MTPTSVGMRCPECSRQKTQVRTLRSLGADPVATYALIAMNVLVYVGSTVAGGGLAGRGRGDIIVKGGLFGPAIHDGHEYWRILTSGFLHAGLLHLAFNMFFLYILGGMLEPALGRGRFVALYFVSLIGGSLGALLITPTALTVGASGACFGVLGGAIAVAMDRGIPIMQSGLGTTAILNLGLSIALPGISIGGHVGGLITGFLAGAAMVRFGDRRGAAPVIYAASVVIGLALFAGAVAVSGRT